jgi:hypothetical protein
MRTVLKLLVVSIIMGVLGGVALQAGSPFYINHYLKNNENKYLKVGLTLGETATYSFSFVPDKVTATVFEIGRDTQASDEASYFIRIWGVYLIAKSGVFSLVKDSVESAQRTWFSEGISSTGFGRKLSMGGINLETAN